MQSSVGIRERIDHVYPSLRPAERAVAQYIRNHIEEAADLTVGQMADIAHVSQPTVIRFARTERGRNRGRNIQFKTPA